MNTENGFPGTFSDFMRFPLILMRLVRSFCYFRWFYSIFCAFVGFYCCDVLRFPMYPSFKKPQKYKFKNVSNSFWIAMKMCSSYVDWVFKLKGKVFLRWRKYKGEVKTFFCCCCSMSEKKKNERNVWKSDVEYVEPPVPILHRIRLVPGRGQYSLEAFSHQRSFDKTLNARLYSKTIACSFVRATKRAANVIVPWSLCLVLSRMTILDAFRGLCSSNV